MEKIVSLNFEGTRKKFKLTPAISRIYYDFCILQVLNKENFMTARIEENIFEIPEILKNATVVNLVC